MIWSTAGEEKPCGRSRKAHQPTVGRKRKGVNAGELVEHEALITDHEYGEEVERPYKCNGCGEPIGPGQAYRWWKPRRGGKYRRHAHCGVPPRSLFTSSEIKATAWDIADQDVPEFGNFDEFADWAETAAADIDDLISTIQDKIDNIVGAFHGSMPPVAEDLDDRRGELESWADTVRNVAEQYRSEWDALANDDEADDNEVTGLLTAFDDAAADVLAECPE